MSGGLELSPDLLATHGRALRGLAYSLLRDADAAEDVVQETWLACLRYPGSMPVRLSSWLGTVASRLALRRKRGESRRRVREGRAASPERLEALQQRTLEREEALRSVTEALLALEEPFKTALLLRFFEERTPSEIAAELGLPVTTVKSRIARGLERLRARLGAELGDEERSTRALLVLAGTGAPVVPHVPPSRPIAAPLTGTLASLSATLQLKVAAAFVLLAGGALWWNRAREEHLSPAPAVLARSGASGASHAQLQAPDRAAPEAIPPADAAEPRREALVSEPTAEAPAEVATPSAGFVYRLSGTIRDERDLPLAGARVFLGLKGLPLNRVAVTDEEGRFALEFAGRRATLDCAFAADDAGARALGLRELHLVAGRDLLVDVALCPRPPEPAPGVPTPSNPSDAAREPTVEIDLSLAESGEEPALFQGSLLAVQAVLGTDLGPFERAPEILRDPRGRGIFVDPPPAQTCRRSGQEPHGTLSGLPLWTLMSRVTLARPVDLHLRWGTLSPIREGFTLFGVDASEPPPQALVRGVVRDARGQPMADVEVGWGRPGRTFEASVRSDAHGNFELADVPPGEVFVRAGGGDHGLACETVTLASGEEFSWDPALDRGDEVVGRIQLADGGALDGLRVELWSASPSSLWCDATLTDEAGRFAFPNVPGGALELHVFASGIARAPSVFPVRSLGPLFAPADVGTIVLAAQDLAAHTLSATLIDAGGGELRVWHVATGRGLFAAPGSEAGQFRLSGLPAGAYRFEAGGPQGWRTLGQAWIEDDLELDLERLPEPGTLVLATGGEVDASTALWSATPDVFARVAARAELEAGVLVVRPGAYVLCAGERGEAPFEVQSGGTTALNLPTSADGAARIEIRTGPAEAEPRAASCTACHAAGG